MCYTPITQSDWLLVTKYCVQVTFILLPTAATLSCGLLSLQVPSLQIKIYHRHVTHQSICRIWKLLRFQASSGYDTVIFILAKPGNYIQKKQKHVVMF